MQRNALRRFGAELADMQWKTYCLPKLEREAVRRCLGINTTSHEDNTGLWAQQ